MPSLSSKHGPQSTRGTIGAPPADRMARRDAWPTNRSRIGLSTAAVNEGTVLRWCFALLAVTMMVGLLGLADGVEAVPLGSPSDFIGASIVINFDDAIGGTSNPAVSGDDARTRYAAQGVTFSNSPGGPIQIGRASCRERV